MSSKARRNSKNQTHDHVLKLWVDNDPHEAAVATVLAARPLDLSGIPALCLAEVLRRFRGLSRGPVSVLLGKRRKYRRGARRQDRRSPPPLRRHVERNLEKTALCVIRSLPEIDIEFRREDLPSLVKQWKSRGGLASREFPEIYKQVWARYDRVVEKQRTFEKGRVP